MTRDGSARALLLNGRDLVRRAAEIHHTTPCTTAALGRALCAASLAGSLMGEKEDLLTLRFKGDGGGGTIVATSDYYGNVRGFIQNPGFDPPLRGDGKLDVAACVGKGELHVLRDTGGSEPYAGISPIVSGEIAEDIAYYYATSEQVPTICVLGVLVDRDYSVKAAGGALIQLLPFADEAIIDLLEENLKAAPPLTQALCAEAPEAILQRYLTGIEFDIFDQIEVEYRCPCDRTRTDRALVSLGTEELTRLIEEGNGAELTCQFCDKIYRYSTSDLVNLRKHARRT